MPQTLDPELRRALAERVRYYRELGIYDLYRRESATSIDVLSLTLQPEIREEMAKKIRCRCNRSKQLGSYRFEP